MPDKDTDISKMEASRIDTGKTFRKNFFQQKINGL
jgi:hypothetical protein